MNGKASVLIWLVLVASLGLTAHPARCAQRSFLMGTSIFSDFFQFTFENPADKDLLSLHIDDFLGIPWTAFKNGTTPPAAWVSRWNPIQAGAASSGKVIYLALSPLSQRKTLTDDVGTNGAKIVNWAPVNSSGCYQFASDPNAAVYKQAYINYAKWAIDLIRPTYFSPAIEMNIEFTDCPDQKAAFIQWYSDVYQALKQTYPELIIFPTLQAENMYGLSDPNAWCGGTKTDASLAACFQQRLSEAVTIPADRIAFSHYPALWNYPPIAPDHYTPTPPYEDMFSRVKQTTSRPIWISETGWGASPILSSYQHASPPASCGAPLTPVPIVNGEANMATHMTNLLAQAQAKQFDAVVWWENRDLVDAALAGQCPCPGTNDSCTTLENVYQAGGSITEVQFRIFSNMGLRNYDGTPRAAIYNTWSSYLSETYVPAVSTSTTASTSSSLDDIHIYPNPLLSSHGETEMNFANLPAGARLRIYTLAGELVRDLSADTFGTAVWNGQNKSGHAVASGTYLVYVQGAGATKTLKVAVQR
jgi:hypothetical protein